MKPRLKALFLVPLLAGFAAFAVEADDVSPLVEKVAEPVKPVSTAASVGTKAFDEATVNELFAENQAALKRRAEAEAPHLNSDNLEVIELGAINAQAYQISNMGELMERLDPQPRRRLARLAELDPAAAADIRVTTRSEERFFAGETDYGSDSNAGSTANVDFREVGRTVTNALQKAKAALREKKVTDDQASLPTEN